MDIWKIFCVMSLTFTLCLSVEASDVPCHTTNNLELGKQGTVSCNFHDFRVVSWGIGDVPVISWDMSVKRGTGYNSRDYDIYPNGSLIINSVQLKHETNFTVTELPQDGPAKHYKVPARVLIPPSPEYPLVNGLTNHQYIDQEEGSYSGSINCTMNGVRPGVLLEWVYQSDVISMKNEPPFIVSNIDGTYNSSLISHYTIMNHSVSEISLKCRVAGEMRNLFRSVTTINLVTSDKGSAGSCTVSPTLTMIFLSLPLMALFSWVAKEV